MTKPIPFHPLANIFPLIEGVQFQDLVGDIKENGLREAIALCEGAILDGRNRYRACLAAKVEPKSVEFKGTDALSFIVSKNLRRRHLKEGQRAMIAARLANMQLGRPSAARGSADISASQAADMLNVSRASVERAKIIVRSATDGLRRIVESGDVSVAVGSTIAKLDPKKQEQMVARGAGALVAEARRLSAMPARQGRSEYAALWPHVDEIISGLEERNLAKTDIAAAALRREISKIASKGASK